MEQISVTDKYFLLADGMAVERYSCSDLYDKLSEMGEFERRVLIKKINDTYGYEAVNYNLMKQQYGKVENAEEVSFSAKEESTNSAFSKDYMKAYMSMLSN